MLRQVQWGVVAYIGIQKHVTIETSLGMDMATASERCIILPLYHIGWVTWSERRHFFDRDVDS